MAASALAVNNSLLPSQSIFTEVQSIHDTGFFHEFESIMKEGAQSSSSTVRREGSWLRLHGVALMQSLLSSI